MAVDETCPVCRTAEIVCGKWTLLLVRDLAEGCSRFCELERSLAGISPRTLSLRLRALEEQEIVERHTFPEVPPRVEYALTEKGRALLPIIDDMRAYGEEWLERRVRRAHRRRTRCSSPSGACNRPVRRAGSRLRRARTERTMHSRQPARQRSRSSSTRRRATCRRRSTAGAEVPFELGSRARPQGPRGTPLYCYHALTGAFIAERESELEELPGYAEAAKLLEGFDGLDRYLASMGAAVRRRSEPGAGVAARTAITALLADVFDEQTDFEVRPERRATRRSSGLERVGAGAARTR